MVTHSTGFECDCRVRSDVVSRVGGAFRSDELERVVTTLHERRGGCSDRTEALDDRLILWALVHTGVFAERVGEPQMRDELDSQTLATERELEERMRTVMDRVKKRGHAGAVARRLV